jgi:hypothetical protein
MLVNSILLDSKRFLKLAQKGHVVFEKIATRLEDVNEFIMPATLLRAGIFVFIFMC